jgi:hypothetical protein
LPTPTLVPCIPSMCIGTHTDQPSTLRVCFIYVYRYASSSGCLLPRPCHAVRAQPKTEAEKAADPLAAMVGCCSLTPE